MLVAVHRLAAVPLAAFLLCECVSGGSAALAADGCLVANVDGGFDGNGLGIVDYRDVARIETVLRDGVAGDDLDRLDLDGDRSITEADRRLVLSYCVRWVEDTCDGKRTCDACPADLDFSGDVDLEDVAAWDNRRTTPGFDCRLDLNRDGRVCPRDLEVLRAYVYFQVPYSDAIARADFDGDGTVDRNDERSLYDAIVGQGGSLDPSCAFDLDRNGRIDVNDRWYVVSSIGQCGRETDNVVLKPDQCDTVIRPPGGGGGGASQ